MCIHKLNNKSNTYIYIYIYIHNLPISHRCPRDRRQKSRGTAAAQPDWLRKLHVFYYVLLLILLLILLLLLLLLLLIIIIPLLIIAILNNNNMNTPPDCFRKLYVLAMKCECGCPSFTYVYHGVAWHDMIYYITSHYGVPLYAIVQCVMIWYDMAPSGGDRDSWEAGGAPLKYLFFEISSSMKPYPSRIYQ